MATTNLGLPTIAGNLTADVVRDINALAQAVDSGVAKASDLTSHKADDVNHVRYAVATGTVNTYAVTLNPAPTAYVEGMAVSVKINVNSSADSTINVNGLGAKGIKKANGTGVTNLKANGIYTLRYDGVNFILQGEGGSGNATASDLLSGKTASTDAGDIVGTIPSKGAQTYTPGTTNQTIASNQYLTGTQTISGDADLIASNIRNGITIFGLTGSLIEGKRSASGTTSSTSGGQLSVNGIGFVPSVVIYHGAGVTEFGVSTSLLGGFSLRKKSNGTGGETDDGNVWFTFTSGSFTLTNLRTAVQSINWTAFE